MTQEIFFEINNGIIEVDSSNSILEGCERLGYALPRFCYHSRLQVAGNCRACLVEIENSPKPQASCAMPLREKLSIHTNTPFVEKAQEGVLEFLLLNHPLDCPICDQGGSCDLQDQSKYFGSDRGRFYNFRRGVEDKHWGPLIKTVMTRCIQCTRCVRFSSKIEGEMTTGITQRSGKSEIGSYLVKPSRSELSSNVIDLCPVAGYPFYKRAWVWLSYFYFRGFDRWWIGTHSVFSQLVLAYQVYYYTFCEYLWVNKRLDPRSFRLYYRASKKVLLNSTALRFFKEHIGFNLWFRAFIVQLVVVSTILALIALSLDYGFELVSGMEIPELYYRLVSPSLPWDSATLKLNPPVAISPDPYPSINHSVEENLKKVLHNGLVIDTPEKEYWVKWGWYHTLVNNVIIVSPWVGAGTVFFLDLFLKGRF